MIANYHSHTIRCNHAFGTEQEYIEAALAEGLQIFGFSDHAPQFFPGSYYSRMRMYPDQLEDYVSTVRKLQTQYANRIQIPLGLEVEYYPAIFPALLDRMRQVGIEYIILGQHWNCNEEGEPYNGRPTEDESRLQQYCDQVIEAMETGLFTYVAHPDILHFTGPDAIFEKHFRRLCQSAKACNVPLEINLLGLDEQRQYPHPLFWQIAASEGCDAIVGIDAHNPIHVNCQDLDQAARQMAAQLGIRVLDTVPLRAI